MSLDWNISNVADHKVTCYVGDEGARRLAPVTEGLIWYTMLCDMGRITEGNWPDFYQRIKLLEGLRGAIVYDGNGDDLLITPEMVRAHIGLSTNVSNVALSKWQNRILKAFMADRQRDYRKLI